MFVLQTNISTSYTPHVTPYTPNEPCHSASPSDYDAYVLLTRLLHYELMNLSNTLTTVASSFIPQTRDPTRSCYHTQRNTQTQSDHIQPLNPVTLHLSSHTTLHLGLYFLSYKNTLVFYLLHHVAPVYLHLYLLLPFDGLTTLVTF